MPEKGITEEKIQMLVKTESGMMLPAKMIYAFEKKYDYNPNICWC